VSSATSTPGGNPLRRAGIPLLILGLVAVLVGVGYVPLPDGAEPDKVRTGILVVFTIASWAMNLLPEPLTTLLFFLCAMLFHIAAPTTVFAGFATPTWWLVLGGTIAGIAIRTTGLGPRLGRLFFGRADGGYRYFIAMVVVACVSLAFLMPSTMGRVLLLIPIVLGLADRLGFTPGRAGRTGLILATAAGSYLPSCAILPANVPNTVLLGAADALYGVKLQYGSYLLLHFPVLGLVKGAVLVWLIYRLFPDTVEARSGAADVAPGRLSGAEQRLVVVLALMLALFATDVLHGISPAWVCLGAGIICLLPQMALVSPQQLQQSLAIGPLMYVAGFLSLSAVIAQSGLGAWAGRELLALSGMTPDAPLANIPWVLAIYSGIGLLTTLPGLPAVLTPVAEQVAHASGLPIETVLKLQVPVFATVFVPYQSPPMMIAMLTGGAAIRDGLKLCLVLSAITVVFILPLDFAWWWLLGEFDL
jgi:di/tricarboxylate transporter